MWGMCVKLSIVAWAQYLYLALVVSGLSMQGVPDTDSTHVLQVSNISNQV